MEVKVERSSTIADGTPSVKTSKLPLTIFDRATLNFHTAYLLAFTATTTTTNVELIQGLETTLVHFPTLTGQLAVEEETRRQSILVGGDGGGVLVVEATVASKLEDHLPLEPSRDFWHLHPPIEGATHLLQVQINRFQCGGLLIGATVHHRVCDGRSMSSFFAAWGKMVRGVAVDPLPVHDRSWLEPRQPPRCKYQDHSLQLWQPDRTGAELLPKNNATDHHVETDKISNMLLHYSSDYITFKLKSLIPDKHTTFEALLGHLWRKITIARRLESEQETLVAIAVNGRPRLRPPVPTEYFGNLVLVAHPEARVRELIRGGVAGAARIVREAVRAIGDDYFRSFIDFGAMHMHDQEEDNLVPIMHEDLGNVLMPNLEADSWLGFGLENVDFGGGGALCGLLPTWIPAEGVIVFLPSMRGDGGVDVLVTLLEEHARVLKEIYLSFD